jgi:hypothetical protein
MSHRKVAPNETYVDGFANESFESNDELKQKIIEKLDSLNPEELNKL